MKPRQPLPDEMAALLEMQSGVMTWAQAERLGLTRGVFRRVARDWTPLGYGLYGPEAPHWESALWAGLLRGGDGSVIGGQSAAFEHGLTLRRPEHVTVWTPPGRRRKDPLRVGPWEVSFRRGHREVADLALPVVRLEDLMPELASQSGGADAFIDAVLAAVKAGKVQPGDVARLVDASPRRIQQDLVSRVATASSDGVESVLEWRFLTAVEQPHGLPRPQRQVWTFAQTRVDVMYDDYETVLELDGRHHDPTVDGRRDNSHAVNHGYLSLRYPGIDVFRRPCAMAREVGRVFERRGWRAGAQPCALCFHHW